MLRRYLIEFDKLYESFGGSNVWAGISHSPPPQGKFPSECLSPIILIVYKARHNFHNSVSSFWVWSKRYCIFIFIRLETYCSHLFNYALAALEISPNHLFSHFLGAYQHAKHVIFSKKKDFWHFQRLFTHQTQALQLK